MFYDVYAGSEGGSSNDACKIFIVNSMMLLMFLADKFWLVHFKGSDRSVQ